MLKLLFLLITFNLHARPKETSNPSNPAEGYFFGHQNVHSKLVDQYEFWAQCKPLPEAKGALPYTYLVKVKGAVTTLTPISPQKKELFSWEVKGQTITKSKKHLGKKNITISSWQDEVAPGVSLRDLLFYQINWHKNYRPTLKALTFDLATLELKKSPAASSLLPYSKIKMSVEKITFLANRIEFYQNEKTVDKTYVISKYTEHYGKYFPRITEITHKNKQQSLVSFYKIISLNQN
jgi:hypothetical protein